MKTHLPLGTMLDELAPMARTIVSALRPGHVAVWLDEQARIACDGIDVAPAIPPESFIGTYAKGAVIDDLLADLLVFRDERFRHALMFS